MKKKNRQFYNIKLLKELERFIKENPDLRFGQILFALRICISNFNYQTQKSDIKDIFYEESSETFKRMKKHFELFYK